MPEAATHDTSSPAGGTSAIPCTSDPHRAGPDPGTASSPRERFPRPTVGRGSRTTVQRRRHAMSGRDDQRRESWYPGERRRRPAGARAGPGRLAGRATRPAEFDEQPPPGRVRPGCVRPGGYGQGGTEPASGEGYRAQGGWLDDAGSQGPSGGRGRPHASRRGRHPGSGLRRPGRERGRRRGPARDRRPGGAGPSASPAAAGRRADTARPPGRCGAQGPTG